MCKYEGPSGPFCMQAPFTHKNAFFVFAYLYFINPICLW